MSGNRLYLVCDPCQKENAEDFGFRLADRGILGAYEVFAPAAASKQFNAWLRKHHKCGAKGKPDHFILAQLNQRNSDQPKPDIRGEAALLQ